MPTDHHAYNKPTGRKDDELHLVRATFQLRTWYISLNVAIAEYASDIAVGWLVALLD